MEKTSYIVMFTVGMTVLVASLLATLFYGTYPQVKQNEDVFNKRAILSAISDKLDQPVDDFSDEEVLALFDQKVEQKVLNMNGEEIDGIMAEDIDLAQERKKPEMEQQLPLYIYNGDGEKIYIVSVRGNGLWNEIWGVWL